MKASLSNQTETSEQGKTKPDLPEYKLTPAEILKFWKIIDEMTDEQKERNFQRLMKRRRRDVLSCWVEK